MPLIKKTAFQYYLDPTKEKDPRYATGTLRDNLEPVFLILFLDQLGDFFEHMNQSILNGKKITLGQYLTRILKEDEIELNNLKKDLNFSLSTTNSLDILKETQLDNFALRNDFIQRFTFPS